MREVPCPFWEKRRSALVLAGLVVFHWCWSSPSSCPRGRANSYFERGVFFVYSPVQRAATGAVRRPRRSGTNYFDLRGVRRRERQSSSGGIFFASQDVRFLRGPAGPGRGGGQAPREPGRASRARSSRPGSIGVDSVNPYQSIVIDKGSLDGIAGNMAVCDRQRGLVGRTIEPGRPERGQGPARHRQGQQRERQVLGRPG